MVAIGFLPLSLSQQKLTCCSANQIHNRGILGLFKSTKNGKWLTMISFNFFYFCNFATWQHQDRPGSATHEQLAVWIPPVNATSRHE